MAGSDIAARTLAPIPQDDHGAAVSLHTLDGARYLRDAQHADPTLCLLAAHHSYAIVEAGERGLADVLGLEFEPTPHVLSTGADLL